MKPEVKGPVLLILRTGWDRDLRDKVLADPRRMLMEAGLQLSEGDKLFVHEEKEGEYHVVLPVFMDKPLASLNKDHPFLPEPGEGNGD